MDATVSKCQFNVMMLWTAQLTLLATAQQALFDYYKHAFKEGNIGMQYDGVHYYHNLLTS
jgi:hypothetical protein